MEKSPRIPTSVTPEEYQALIRLAHVERAKALRDSCHVPLFAGAAARPPSNQCRLARP